VHARDGAFSAAREISATITLAPSRANRIAPARPIPEPLPVMKRHLAVEPAHD